jgi:predicted RNA-binding Zn ribbon-like protein
MTSSFASVLFQEWVLDFLNTAFQHRGTLLDLFQCDEDAVAWLDSGKALGVIIKGKSEACSGLAAQARTLRENLRKLLLQRKAGEFVYTELLNDVLTMARCELQLVDEGDGNLRAVHQFLAETPEQVLAPMAFSAAALLAEGDFRRIRKGDCPDCQIWFLDKTKASNRKWCNIALCRRRFSDAPQAPRPRTTP